MITLIILIAAVVVAVIVVAKQPSDFRISRSQTFNAPVAAVFPHVNNLQNWNAWSPWAKMDPAAKNSFAGPEAGVEAAMSWIGNNKVGEGTMTIIASRPDEFVQLKLDFIKPFKATNIAEFTFTQDGNQTAVTWSMTGTNNFIGKAMALVMNFDKMVGGQFEQGLASLKSIVEA